MALSNMVVYQEQVMTTMIEILQTQTVLFNAAVGNALILRAGNHRGDFTQMSFFKSMGNMIRRRNPYSQASIATMTFEMDEKVSVKVGSGTPLVQWSVTQFKWINLDPALAGTIAGKNLAFQMFQEYFNLALLVVYAALRNEGSDVRTDLTLASGTPGDANKASHRALTAVQAKFGDASQNIKLWVTHSKPVFDLYDVALVNSNELFKYENIRVVADPLGKPIVISDSPSLVDTVTVPSIPKYRMLGLTEGAVIIEQNDDFTQQDLPVLGLENIAHEWQAEWSFNLMVKGYSWDMANGGKAPNNAALVVSANWDRHEDNLKLLPGVILEVN